MKYDFEGWATVNGMRCADGVTISKGAFDSCDGKKVPLIWNHVHDRIGCVLGHGILEKREKGIWVRGSFNNTAAGREAKETLRHGDIESLSIFANNVQKIGSNVIHGVIREVSLVLAGANPGAFVESVVEHGMPLMDGEEEAVIYNSEEIYISHAEPDDPKEPPKSKKEEGDDSGDGKTVKEVIEAMTEEQKQAMAIMVGAAIQDTKKQYEKGGDDDDEEEDEPVKHHLFEDGSGNRGVTITKEDMQQIIRDGKAMGSFKEAMIYHSQEGILAHAFDTTGMEVAEGTKEYGVNDMSMLFPDYKTLNTTPEFLSRNMDWVQKFMSRVHRTPFSRIKSQFADITEDEARAKGYITGKRKKEEVFTLLKRVTDPTTIYKKQKFDRDDLLDISGFDFLNWIKQEMRLMLNEEVARACMISDGRPSDSEDKIKEANIRPILKENPLFASVIKVSVAADADEATIAKETIKAVIRGRKKYKGSGKPDFWTTEDVTTEMLLLENGIGESLYKTEAELSTKLRVNEIIPVEPMEGHTVSIDSKSYPLIGLIFNPVDYNIGTDKGGEITFMDGFDIDYNQQKFLLETRMSGALIKPFSALVVILDKAASARSSAA